MVSTERRKLADRRLCGIGKEWLENLPKAE
jgi:hypothetical protein